MYSCRRFTSRALPPAGRLVPEGLHRDLQPEPETTGPDEVDRRDSQEGGARRQALAAVAT